MTSATTQAQPVPPSTFAKAWSAFRTWRRTRPFWGGLFIVFAAGPILYFPYYALSLGALRIQMATTAGAGSAVIGLLLIALGISTWFQPLIRVFAGIATIVLSLVSIPVANFGGFGLGLIFGILGGGLVCAWAPLKAQPEAAEGVAESVAAPAADLMADPMVKQAVEGDTEVLLPTQQSAEAGAAPQPQAEASQEESKSVE